MSNEKILEAVKTIKEVCEEYQHCYDCPYGTEESVCNITETGNPDGWNLSLPQPFKAFL